jgi:hypothetical protein
VPLLESLTIRSVADIASAWDALWEVLAPSRAAQCAIDMALWDWLARREGISAAELAWGRAPRPVRTFCTIGLSSPEELAEKIEELASFPLIKIKSDSAADLETIRLVRERTKARLAVDANCAWAEHDLHLLSERLHELGVIFIEQPLPPGEEVQLARRSRRLPVVADESCVTLNDVADVDEWFDGFNIKLGEMRRHHPGSDDGAAWPAARVADDGRLHAGEQRSDRCGCSGGARDRLCRSRRRMAADRRSILRLELRRRSAGFTHREWIRRDAAGGAFRLDSAD